MDPATGLIAEFVKQGILGLVIIALVLGWLVPKWVIDEYRVRLAVKDKIIERQSALIERLAARAGGVKMPELPSDTNDEP